MGGEKGSIRWNFDDSRYDELTGGSKYMNQERKRLEFSSLLKVYW